MCAVVCEIVLSGACTSSVLDRAETGISIVDLLLSVNFDTKIDSITELVFSI